MKKWFKRVGAVVSVLVLGAVAYCSLNYVRYNQETGELNDGVRQGTTGSYVRLSDGVTHYELAGPENVRTVVLVHGFSVPYYLWDPTFDALVKSGIRTLRYDLYGRGYSDRPDTKYDADLYDRQLSDLLRALKIHEAVDLVGASMGGPVAVVFAARHPEQTRTLSLFDPAYFDGHALGWRLSTPLVGEYVMAVYIAPTLAEGQRDDFQHPERFPDYFPKYQAQMRYKGFRRALLSTLRYYFQQDLRSEYQRVGQNHKPVLAVWGKEDRDVPLAASKDLLAAIPQAQLHVIDDSAHVPFIEHPEIVNPMFIEFLNKN
jgi:pimeloyl-ACP methyl ester carboxylesterase